MNPEGTRTRWYGWASNPGGGVRRFLVGSTPAAFRQEWVPLGSDSVQQRLVGLSTNHLFRNLANKANEVRPTIKPNTQSRPNCRLGMALALENASSNQFVMTPRMVIDSRNTQGAISARSQG